MEVKGIDIKRVVDGIEVSMKDYADSLEDIREIRSEYNRKEPLT